MQVVLHSNKFHLIIISLIILDIIIVLFELLLDVGALGESRIQICGGFGGEHTCQPVSPGQISEIP